MRIVIKSKLETPDERIEGELLRRNLKPVLNKVTQEFIHQRDITAATNRDLSDAMTPHLVKMAKRTARSTAKTIGIKRADWIDKAINDAEARAIRRGMAAGRLILNANRNKIQNLIKALGKGKVTSSQVIKSLAGNQRLQNIVDIELGKAKQIGAGAAFKASKKPWMKRWYVSEAHDTPDVCDDNEADGQLQMSEDFTSGETEPPAHPNCECDLVYELLEE